MRRLSLAQAQKAFPHLPDLVRDRPVFISAGDRPGMVVLSADQYQGLHLTIAILRDHAFARRLRRSVPARPAAVCPAVEPSGSGRHF